MVTTCSTNARRTKCRCHCGPATGSTFRGPARTPPAIRRSASTGSSPCGRTAWGAPPMPDDVPVIRRFAGRHVLAELDHVDPALLDDPIFLREALASAVTEAGATLCEVISHRFTPQGVTVLAMLAESH